MKFNLKVIVLGGLAMYVSHWLVSMVSGPVIHEGILDEMYQANAPFWRPELNQHPPDMAALMPRWIATGLTASLIMAGIFDNIRAGLEGSSLMRGVKFGIIISLIYICMSAGWSGVFNLPEMVWVWWSVEALVAYVVGGAVLGLVVGKLSPE